MYLRKATSARLAWRPRTHVLLQMAQASFFWVKYGFGTFGRLTLWCERAGSLIVRPALRELYAAEDVQRQRVLRDPSQLREELVRQGSGGSLQAEEHPVRHRAGRTQQSPAGTQYSDAVSVEPINGLREVWSARISTTEWGVLIPPDHTNSACRFERLASASR
jgi:hypothetical protein